MKKNIDERIKELLEHFGVTDELVIDEEAKEHVLLALSSKDIAKVYIDTEQGLCIDFYGD